MIEKLLSTTRHIIWDWNGTLLNDADCCVAVLNVILAKRRLALISLPLYRKIFNFPLPDFYAKIGIDFKVDSMDHIAKEFIQHYEEAKFKCHLQPLGIETLSLFSRSGISQSICSASHHDLLEKALAHFGIQHFFSAAYGVDNIKAHGKKNLLIVAMQPLNFAPQETLMIGDTLNDHEISSELGLSCLLVAHGHHDKARLQKAHHLVLDDFSPLLVSVNRR